MFNTGKEADFAAWSTMFWARVLEGKVPPCDDEENGNKKRKRKRKKSADCSGACGDGGCSNKDKACLVLHFFQLLKLDTKKSSGYWYL